MKNGFYKDKAVKAELEAENSQILPKHFLTKWYMADN